MLFSVRLKGSMDSKKRMMFVLDEDYYFVTIKILTIIYFIAGFNKTFVDYRKIPFIIELDRDSKRLKLYEKAISGKSLNIFEHEELTSIYCSANLNYAMIERVIYFLDKQNIIRVSKNSRFGCIDLELVRKAEIKDLLEDDIFSAEYRNLNVIKSNMSRIATYKFETFISKIYGKNEVAKWEDWQ